MQLVVLAPSAPPVVLPLAPLDIDSSDSGTLAWLDLDRTEASELSRMVPKVPAPIARELMYALPTPRLRDRSGFRWLSLLAVGEAGHASGLADLDVLVGPGLLVTVHSGERPSLQRLWIRRGGVVSWRPRYRGPGWNSSSTRSSTGTMTSSTTRRQRLSDCRAAVRGDHMLHGHTVARSAAPDDGRPRATLRPAGTVRRAGSLRELVTHPMAHGGSTTGWRRR